jgi:hypothetical protein
MPIEESTIILSFVGILIGALLREIIHTGQRLMMLEYKIDHLDPSTDNKTELNDIKEILIELKGMVSVSAYYQVILRPPRGGGQT